MKYTILEKYTEELDKISPNFKGFSVNEWPAIVLINDDGTGNILTYTDFVKIHTDIIALRVKQNNEKPVTK